ncbi:MAG: alpha/beta fold hydrolase [Candidatus Hydrogenedentes bacterium]|nr:alpha/beta fold hydrolase [Candidatus Hydrogenedentota bacterium]
MISDGIRRVWRRRPLLAYGFVSLAVGLTLLNLVTDRLVTRYEQRAARDPGSPYLKGMTPRTLGPSDSPRAVLFVHGFIGGQSNFHDLPDQVAAAGWRVRTMRLPGHGTSPRDFERTSTDALLDGVLAELRALKQEHETVVVVGHSLGGALSTLAAAREPVDGLVLCAPFFGLTLGSILGLPTERLVDSAATLLRWVPARPGNGPVNKVENKPFIDCYAWIPAQGAIAALDAGERAKAPEVLGQIRCPLLLIHSRNDTVTSFAASEDAFSGFASERRELIPLEKSDHVIFWDYDEHVVAESVLRYLKEVEHHDPD